MRRTRVSTNWSRNDIPLKAWHHFKLKLKQLFCLHGRYVYLKVTTQRKQEGGNVVVYGVGCKKCGWMSTYCGYAGMPRTLRDSYDRTYLKITNKHDVLLSDIEQSNREEK